MGERVRLKVLTAVLVILVVFAKVVPSACYKQGLALTERGKCEPAYILMKTAYFFNPDNKDYRYYYTKSMMCMPVTMDIQKRVFKIADSAAEDSAAVLAQNRIADWKYAFGENYIEQAPSNEGIIRWDTQSFPLKIYYGAAAAVPQYYETRTWQAFSQWENSSGFLKFKRVDKKYDANIVVEVVPAQHNCQGERCQYIMGVTEPVIKSRRLESMKITMYAKDPAGNYFSEKDFFNTIIHEAGHALGVMGHSYNEDDIMYLASDESDMYKAYRSDFQSLSERDVNTIKLLYRMVPEISNGPCADSTVYPPVVLGSGKVVCSRKIKEALYYIKQAPDMSAGYVDLGSAYAQDGQIERAVEAFEQGLARAATDEEKYIIYYNMAVVYINNRNPEQARKYALQAQAIDDNQEIRDLVESIK